MAGTASLAGLGAFVTGMALSSPSDTGPIQAFGSVGGAAPVKVTSGPGSTDSPTSQASRGERSEFPLATPQPAPALPQDSADELPDPYFDDEVYDYERYDQRFDQYERYDHQPDKPSGQDEHRDGWSVPLASADQSDLAPSSGGAGTTTGVPPTSTHSTSPLPPAEDPSAVPHRRAPDWLAEPPWVPPPSTSRSTSGPVVPTPVVPKPVVPNPPTTAAPTSPAKPAPHGPQTRPVPPAHPVPPASAPSAPSSPAPSGTTLPFQPILDDIVAGNPYKYFQVTPTPQVKPPSPPLSSPPPAPVWPHD